MTKRTYIPKPTEKRAFQQACSACVFCREAEVASLQIHHIDGDPSNNDLSNLLVVCGTCHGKITGGVLSEADVSLHKRMAELGAVAQPQGMNEKAVNVNVVSSNFHGDIAHTITKISSPKAPRVQHPPGSIGANLEMKGYVDYLISRYYDYRKADAAYGVKRRFSHAVIHRNIEKKFGYKTFFMPYRLFEDLVAYLQDCIDRTIQGKRNSKGKRKNYHSFKEHGRGA